jgi:hypothetical protein
MSTGPTEDFVTAALKEDIYQLETKFVDLYKKLKAVETRVQAINSLALELGGDIKAIALKTGTSTDTTELARKSVSLTGAVPPVRE